MLQSSKGPHQSSHVKHPICRRSIFSRLITSKSITLPNEVLALNITLNNARIVFMVVEHGSQRLKQIQHIGPTNGKV
ncbi:hypothetical protein BDV12DRAFT_171573 [Aspergillus spectabilis]